MTTPKNYYAELLHEMQDAETYYDHRTEQVEALTQYSMQEGNEFYPYEEENLREAFSELIAAEAICGVLQVVLEKVTATEDEAKALVMFGVTKLAKAVAGYWEEAAYAAAEKEVE